MNAGNGKFALLNVSQDIKSLFKMAGLNDFFVFIDNEDELFV
jgi:anti-anti-sigma regulatory factor